MLESPKVMLMDGTLMAWGIWLVAHGAEGLTIVLTLVLLTLRVMIAWRQWRRG